MSERILLIYVVIKLKEKMFMNASPEVIASGYSARAGKRRLHLEALELFDLSLQPAQKRANIPPSV